MVSLDNNDWRQQLQILIDEKISYLDYESKRKLNRIYSALLRKMGFYWHVQVSCSFGGELWSRLDLSILKDIVLSHSWKGNRMVTLPKDQKIFFPEKKNEPELKMTEPVQINSWLESHNALTRTIDSNVSSRPKVRKISINVDLIFKKSEQTEEDVKTPIVSYDEEFSTDNSPVATRLRSSRSKL